LLTRMVKADRWLPRSFRVTAADGPVHGLDLPVSRADPEFKRHVTVILRTGTVVKDGGQFVEPFLAGPLPDRLRKIIHNGQAHWVLERTFMKVENPHGGFSVGGFDYLERID
jgi:hypothetical protein